MLLLICSLPLHFIPTTYLPVLLDSIGALLLYAFSR